MKERKNYGIIYDERPDGDVTEKHKRCIQLRKVQL